MVVLLGFTVFGFNPILPDFNLPKLINPFQVKPDFYHKNNLLLRVKRCGYFLGVVYFMSAWQQGLELVGKESPKDWAAENDNFFVKKRKSDGSHSEILLSGD